MILEELLRAKKLVEYKATKNQIKDLFVLIQRDIKDSEIVQLSLDRKFISLYSAGYLLAIIILYVNGYRTRGEAHHHTAFEVAKHFLPKESDVIEYFDRCRVLRNKTEYDRSGIISKSEIVTLRRKVGYFKNIVMKLAKNYND